MAYVQSPGFLLFIEVDYEPIQLVVAAAGEKIDLWVTGLAEGAHTLSLRENRGPLLYDVRIVVSHKEPVSAPPCCAWELGHFVGTRRLIRSTNITLVLVCCEEKRGVQVKVQQVISLSDGSGRGLLRPFATNDTSYRAGRHSFEFSLDYPPGTRGQLVVVADGPAGGAHVHYFLDETFKFRSIAPSFGPIHIMHIGASEERFDSSHPLCCTTLGRCDVTTFEPQEEYFQNAIFGTAVRRRTTLNIAVGAPASDEDERVLHITAFRQCSSLYPPDVKELVRFSRDPGHYEVVQKLPISPVSLDQMAAHGELPSTVDFLIMDTQGAEHEIISTGASVVADVLVAVVEVHFKGMYQGAPLFSEVDVLMRNLGFEFYRNIGVATGKFASPSPTTMRGDMMLEADALFLPNAARIAALPTERLLKLAMIMHECYDEFDFAMAMLASREELEPALTDYRARFTALEEILLAPRPQGRLPCHNI